MAASKSVGSAERPNGSKRVVKPALKAARQQAGNPWIREYQRYFVAPATTPDSFRIFDRTEGASFTFSSHT